MYASQLMAHIAQELRDVYRDREDRVRFHYLPMPRALRTVAPGSFGTHWTLQPRITVRSPKDETVEIDGAEARRQSASSGSFTGGSGPSPWRPKAAARPSTGRGPILCGRQPGKP